MQRKKLLPLLLAILLTASCAEMNTALESANQALGTLNDSIGGTTGSRSGNKQTIPLADKNTAQFETRNMQLEVYPDGCRPNGDMVSLSDEVRNKTGKNFTFVYGIPTHTQSGARTGSISNQAVIAPNEWKAITTIPSCAEKYDTSKLELKAHRF